MKKDELDAVFMVGPEAEGDEDMAEEDTEAEEALDAAIDEAFSAKDPETRRMAFKNAVRLCKESEY